MISTVQNDSIQCIKSKIQMQFLQKHTFWHKVNTYKHDSSQLIKFNIGLRQGIAKVGTAKLEGIK